MAGEINDEMVHYTSYLRKGDFILLERKDGAILKKKITSISKKTQIIVVMMEGDFFFFAPDNGWKEHGYRVMAPIYG